MGFGQIPEQNMGKRPASQEADTRPDKRGIGMNVVEKDLKSMGSVASLEPDVFTDSHAAASVPVDKQPRSQQRSTRSQNRSMKNVVIEAELLDHMLTLLLQSSRRLNDLEATNYYTHMIPTSSEMCMHIDQVYQGYLVTAQGNKEHTMGPPAIHRGIALLRQVMNWEESLQKKDGLKVMWPVVKAALDELTRDETELGDAQSIVGHCKISTMYERSNTRLTFTFPQIVECCGKTTTLGSVVSRLLRSMGYARKLGVAPPGFLDRKLSEGLTALRDK
jgi:hypothetical protein